MNKTDLIEAKPGIDKLIEQMGKNLDKRIAEEKEKSAAKQTPKK